MSLYRQAKNPLVAGELRMKSWSMLQTGLAQDDPKWSAKCKQYWELQERLFGFKATDYAMSIDNDGGFVSTYVMVKEILPGERTLDYSRVPVEAAGVARLTQ